MLNTVAYSSVSGIMGHYNGMPPGVLANLYRILMHGRLGGTGRVLILPVDQGFEHGPVDSFTCNMDAYDPEYHITLAIEAGLSAYAAPLGMLECIAAKYAGMIPLILKMNSANKLKDSSAEPYQALTSSVDDALRIGCSAVGLTIYPGSGCCDDMIETAVETINYAKSVGLPTVIWAYPRGSGLTKDAETSVDVIGYAVHIASLIGAHIIKVKIPNHRIFMPSSEVQYKKHHVKLDHIRDRVAHIKQCAFNGKRIVIFSGGAEKDIDVLRKEVTGIRDGGGNGSIIGRNVFQRPRQEALTMLDVVVQIYSDLKI